MVNPDLASERARATFDVDALTNVLEGGHERRMRKDELRRRVHGDPLFRDSWKDGCFPSRAERYKGNLKRVRRKIEMTREMGISSLDDFRMLVSARVSLYCVGACIAQ